MEQFDKERVASQMTDAMATELRELWADVKEYAKAEALKTAAQLQMIKNLRDSDLISEDEARLHFEIQKNASRSVLLTVKGMGILSVENAINAALSAIRDGINAALGFALIK